MSDCPTTRTGHAILCQTSPHARIIEVALQVFDEALDATPFEMAA